VTVPGPRRSADGPRTEPSRCPEVTLNLAEFDDLSAREGAPAPISRVSGRESADEFRAGGSSRWSGRNVVSSRRFMARRR
jgi:hypothetical protein